MASGPPVERADAGHGFWWHVAVGSVGVIAPICLSMWLLHGWIERRFGVSEDIAGLLAGVPGGVLGTLAIRAVLGTRPSTDPEQRRREAEADGRQLRTWIILALGVLLVGQVGRLLAAYYGLALRDDDWSFVCMVASFVGMGVTDLLSSRKGVPPEMAHFEQAAQCEALRVGYLVIVVAGVTAGVVAVRLPWVAGQAWAPVLLASVLAAEIRMATLLRRRAAPEAGEAA